MNTSSKISLFVVLLGIVSSIFLPNSGIELNLFKFNFIYQRNTVEKNPIPQPSNNQPRPLSKDKLLENIENTHRIERESCKTLENKFKQLNVHNNPSEHMLELQRTKLKRCAARVEKATRELNEIESQYNRR